MITQAKPPNKSASKNSDDERWEKLLVETPDSALSILLEEVEADIENGDVVEIETYCDLIDS
jgi:hypothetical protein